MKIIRQTPDDLVLKDGGIGNYVLMGIILVFTLSIVGFMVISAGRQIFSGPGLICLAFVVVEMLVLSAKAIIVVEIDKVKQQILYQKRRLFGKSSFTYSINDVEHVETRKQWKMGRSGGNAAMVGRPVGTAMPELMKQSVIVFKDGSILPIDQQRGACGMQIGAVGSFGSPLITGGGKEASVAAQVATFLGVPFKEIDPPRI